MTQSIEAISVHAIYEGDGVLTLLEPVDLKNGDRVLVKIKRSLENLSHDEIQTKMREAGILADVDLPPDAVELTAEERDQIGRILAGERPVEDYIDEDRGEY